MPRAIRVLAVVATLWIAAGSGHGAPEERNPVQPRAAKYLEDPGACLTMAVEAGEWLLRKSTETEAGITFGHGPAVYSGDAGVALFLARLYDATRTRKWLDATERTLRQAMAAAGGKPGLYTGWAGIGEACLYAQHATGKARFLLMAKQCARKLEGGIPDTTDIISGAAGVTVFLLNLYGKTGEGRFLAHARRLGDHLVSSALRSDGRASWPIAPGQRDTVYLGFSHGAAGIGYALLHLAKRTGDRRYRELALEAARFVLEHEETRGDEGAHWWRTVPRSSRMRRVQWCHGAPGIGLFFLDLHRLLRTEAAGDALQRCLETTRRRGRGARASGCQCHGVAGNAELLLEAYRTGHGDPWRDEARRFASTLLEEVDGVFRLKTGIGAASYEPSYMTGLAGIGHFLLRLARPERIPLPMMVRK